MLSEKQCVSIYYDLVEIITKRIILFEGKFAFSYYKVEYYENNGQCTWGGME